MWEKKLRQNLGPLPSDWPRLTEKDIASVLVLLYPTEESKGFEILLTKRTSKVLTHKGQISFPGGFPEKEDNHLLETALRETREEIGLSPEAIEVLGILEPVTTGLQIKIIPFLGLVSHRQKFVLSAEEVEKVFFLPGSELLAKGLKPVVANELHYRVQSIGITWEEELIWGATAKILEQIYSILMKDL
jgi:8-oxo-dGTP pyrophosphatase MutT (NUDIX family)